MQSKRSQSKCDFGSESCCGIASQLQELLSIESSCTVERVAHEQMSNVRLLLEVLHEQMQYVDWPLSIPKKKG